ncbi:MAG: sulfurtransferase [SAR202 cluster bacterium]|nr:sulfurtransferase [SAR202 cluster bacterium]|tara:strand:+ start:256 stop:948 length:693 start_codon:yes stop_codon:yes gene_type:complete
MNTTDGYANPDLLAETTWLAENLSNANVRIIDGRPEEKYVDGHIEGAINLEFSAVPGDVEATDGSDFAGMLAAQGIGDQHIIVCYDDAGPPAARLWWLLSYFGVENVRVLNGGINKWVQEGRDVTSEKPNHSPASFVPKIVGDLVCSLDHAKKGVNDSGTVFWDTRLEGEYTGEINRGNAADRVGHIPGAVHLEWSTLIEQSTQTIKPANEIRAILEAKGITPDKEVLTY